MKTIRLWKPESVRRRLEQIAARRAYLDAEERKARECCGHDWQRIADPDGGHRRYYECRGCGLTRKGAV